MSHFFKGIKPGAGLGSRRHSVLMAMVIILLLFLTTPAVEGTILSDPVLKPPTGDILDTHTGILQAPKGGETLKAGETYDIKWSELPPFPAGLYLYVHLSTDSGETWKEIHYQSLQYTTQQYFVWTVPNLPTTKARIRIQVWCLNGSPFLWGDEQSADFTIKPLKPWGWLFFVSAPSNLKATAISSSQIDLAWSDNSNNETEFVIERKAGSGSYEEIGSVDKNFKNYSDKGLTAGTTYTYRVKAAGNGLNILDSKYSNESCATTEQKIIRYYIGSVDYYVDDQIHTMDTVPIIIDDTAFLPLRFVIEPLNATLEWGDTEQKVTIKLNGKTIELWIGSNTALINGASTPIAPDNPEVKPLLMDNRTMLPLRFVTEALGCDVEWIADKNQIKVMYSKVIPYLDPQPEPPM